MNVDFSFRLLFLFCVSSDLRIRSLSFKPIVLVLHPSYTHPTMSSFLHFVNNYQMAFQPCTFRF